MAIKYEVVNEKDWGTASTAPQDVKHESKLMLDMGRLFDFAQERMDSGFTFSDLPSDFGWSRPYFFMVVRELRNLGRDGSLALPCEPQGQRKQWRYRLTAEQTPNKRWSEYRLGVTFSVLGTQLAVASAMCNATDPGTREGKSWLWMRKLLGRLCEDVKEMIDSGDLDSISS